MVKYLIFFTLTLTFLGCGSSGSDNPVDTSSPRAPAPPTIPMLVVLVNYNDVNITSTEATWSSKMFGNNSGELNNYFNEVSNSKFAFYAPDELNNSVISVNLDKNHPNTSIDSSFFNSNVHPDFALALSSVDDTIDFSAYDSDNDGHVQPDELLVTFIMAGYEDAYEGSHVTQGVWAHQSCTDSSNTPTLDGVTIMGCNNYGNFAVFGERHNKSNPHDATIGIIAHELGHSAFALPDLYNTYNSNSGGIGYFGLMGAGTWTYANSSEYPGQTPVHMSAWSKTYTGWVTPDETNGSKELNATSSTSYNVLKVQNGSKYLLLENRDNSGYDRGLFALSGNFNGGIAIWEIDESKITQTSLALNIVNTDTQNKGVDLVEAVYGTIDAYGDGGDENALFYSENISTYSTTNLNITNISSRGLSMTLNVN